MRSLIVILFLLLLPWTSSPLQAQSIPVGSSRYPAQQTATTVLGRGEALAVAWSPDGQWFAVASSIGVWLYEVPTLLANPNAVPLALPTTAPVLDVAFSPSEPMVAAALGDGSILLWAWQHGEPARRLNAYEEVAHSLAFTMDGTQLVTIGENGLGARDHVARVWEVASLSLVRDLIDPSNLYPINALALSPNGQLLALADDGGSIHLWQLATGAKIGSWEAHFWQIRDLAFGANSEWLISGATDEEVRGWNVATFARMAALTYQAGGSVEAVAVSPDGTRTASLTNEPQLHIAFASGGLQSVVTLAGKSGIVRDVAFSSDGRLLATVGGDGATHVQLWDMEGVNPVEKVAVAGFQRDMIGVIPYGGALLGIGLDGLVQHWALDGTQGTVWDLQGQHSEHLSRVALHPSGTHIVTGDMGGGVRRWSIADQQLEVQYAEGQSVLALAYNSDGSRLLIGGESRAVQIWQQPDSQLLYRLQTSEAISSLAVRPGSNTVAVGLAFTGRIELWDGGTGAFLAALPESHFGGVEALAFTTDGELMASAGGGFFDQVMVWDMHSNTRLHSLTGFEDATVYSVAFSPDGRRLVAGGSDGRIVVWEMPTGEEITTLVGHVGEVNDMRFSADGTQLYSAGADGTLRVWNMP